MEWRKTKINSVLEIWKPIKNYEGLYEVSNFGNIRSISSRWGERKNPRIVKQQLTQKKYKRVTLSKDNKKRSYMVHVLVYEAFNTKIPLGYEINHKNFIRNDNNKENLELMTHEENVRYSKAIKVKQYDMNHNLVKRWNGIREIEGNLRIDHRQVCDNLKGKQKSCHGFIFEYEEV